MSLINEIMKLKKEKDAIFLVHNYQRPEIQEIADYVGDSLGLSKKAAEVKCKTIVFCGVNFMAETAKILSPEKMVLLPVKEAGCPMADMVKVDELLQMKEKYHDAVVVSYVNTNADVKAESFVCCTSRNAVKVIQNVPAKKIIFTPDRNLANYVAKFTDKEIIPWDGFCYVHQKFTPADVKKAKEMHPEAVVIVHPECKKEVIELADEVLSTEGMVEFAKKTSAKKIIVGTEEGIIYRMKKEAPDKIFYSLGPPRMCKNMKLNTLFNVYMALKEEKHKIELPTEIMEKAKIALDRMLQYI